MEIQRLSWHRQWDEGGGTAVSRITQLSCFFPFFSFFCNTPIVSEFGEPFAYHTESLFG